MNADRTMILFAPARSIPAARPNERAVQTVSISSLPASTWRSTSTSADRVADATSGIRSAASLAADAALLSLFALHHSVFAREPVKHALGRLLPPNLVRSVYVWVASLLLIAVCAWWWPIGGYVYDDSVGPRKYAHALLQLLGLWITARGVARIPLRHHTSLVTEVRATGYLTKSLRLAFRRRPQSTVVLYQPSLQWPMYGVEPSRTSMSSPGSSAASKRPPSTAIRRSGVGAPIVVSAGAMQRGVTFERARAGLVPPPGCASRVTTATDAEYTPGSTG